MYVKPTERQLSAIVIIEKKLPYVKFTGTTRKEAFEFIQRWMETSKQAKQHYERSFSDSSYSKKMQTSQDRKSDRDQYEKYIEEISWNYVEAAGDDGWGGIASRDMARRLHPFESWKRMKG